VLLSSCVEFLLYSAFLNRGKILSLYELSGDLMLSEKNINSPQMSKFLFYELMGAQIGFYNSCNCITDILRPCAGTVVFLSRILEEYQME
jgi:hypothetical protein